jgi:hypothetical protein
VLTDVLPVLPMLRANVDAFLAAAADSALVT